MLEKYIMPAFDWSALIETVDASPPKGTQVINVFSTDKPFIYNQESIDFVKEHLENAIAFDIDAQVLKFACEQITIDGVIAEMGVCTGRTINFIAALNPHSIVYGFDSFEGLPETWNRNDYPLPKGVFSFHNPQKPPAVLNNVKLAKGLFENTLPVFADEILKDRAIAFLHIDCDLYSSTKDIFEIIGSHLKKGSIVLFDELYNYPKWEEHEFKALTEFLASSGKKVEYIAFNKNWEQVAVRFLS